MAEDAVARTMIEAVEGRVDRCEANCQNLSDDMRECKEHAESLRGKLWDKMNKIEVDVAKSSVKVALLVGGVAALLGAVLSAGMTFLMK